MAVKSYYTQIYLMKGQMYKREINRERERLRERERERERDRERE